MPRQIEMFGSHMLARRSDTAVHHGTAEIIPSKQRGVARRDRWFNQRNNFGGSADPMTNTRFARRRRLGRGEIESLFRQDWISRKAVEAPPRDSTRKWINWLPSDNPDPADAMESEFKRLNVRKIVRDADIEARLFGGSVIVVGAFDGQEVTEPLDVDRVRFVRFLHVVDRFLAHPLRFVNDPDDPEFGKPETYLINRPEIIGVASQEVHASRVIRFDGEFLPRLQRISNFGWGDSVMEKLHEALRQYGVATQSGAATLQDFVIKSMKIGNLRELLAGGNFDAVEKRISEAAGMMAIHNIVAVGEDEEIVKMGTPIRGMENMIDLYISIVSSATGIARSRLFHAMGGKLAGDGGATADLVNYYDDIHEHQEDQYRPALDRIISILGAPMNLELEDVPYEFAPLVEMTEEQKAEIRFANAQSDALYIQNNVLDPDEVALARFGGAGVATGEIVIDPATRSTREIRTTGGDDDVGGREQ